MLIGRVQEKIYSNGQKQEEVTSESRRETWGTCENRGKNRNERLRGID